MLSTELSSGGFRAVNFLRISICPAVSTKHLLHFTLLITLCRICNIKRFLAAKKIKLSQYIS